MRSIDVFPSARLHRAADGVISHQFTDSVGEPGAPPTGELTVAVTHSDGVTVAVGAIEGDDSEARTVTVDAGEILRTDWLTAVWSLDDIVIATDLIEVVGGTIGTVAQLQATDSNLTSVEDDAIIEARTTVEDMSLAILGRSVFERFYVERRDGTGRHSMVLAWPDLIEVAWVRGWSGITSEMWATDDVIGITRDSDGIAHLAEQIWSWGYRTIEIGYRFGMRGCPRDLLMALRKSVRHALNEFDTGVPAYAASMQTADGFSIGIAGPGNEDWATGDINIDRVVNRYKIPQIGIL